MSRKPGEVLRLALELLAYNLLLLPLLPIIAVWIGWRIIVLHKPIGRWRDRFGLVPPLPRTGGPRILVHAVSAGEMTAAAPVVAELRRRFPESAIAVSTHTDTGMEMARKSCSSADAFLYLPFDCLAAMGLALLRLRPDLVVIVEKELWPNFLAAARLQGAAVIAVNGRVSDRMVRRARVLPSFVRRLYQLVDVICVQSEDDARRLRGIGLSGRFPLILLAGNTKADTVADRDAAAEARLADTLAVSSDELWLVAGSTHPGEEEQVADAYLAIREREPSARLLLAPRHLERLPEVFAMLAEKGLHVVARSEGRPAGSEAAVVLDTMGELRAAYALGVAGFVGGTLVPVGGHNLLEPPAVGVPVLFGPHTENCADTADLLLNAGVGIRIADGAALANELLRLASDAHLRAYLGQQAEQLVREQRGASARCVAAATDLLAAKRVSTTTAARAQWASLITGSVRGPFDRLALAALWALSVAYGAAVRVHHAGYRLRLARRTRLPALVVSIGNITVGGTGKTTTAIAVARWLSDRGRRVAILSRGYRGSAERRAVVVSEGFGPLVGADVGGDEPYLMAAALPGVSVLVGRDRRRTGRQAVERLGADVIVLDDGFQYQRLAKDIELALVDALAPFGYDFLVPRGLLREPPGSLARADAIWITHSDLVREGDLRALRAQIALSAPTARVCETRHLPLRLRELAGGDELPPEAVRGRRLLALSSIGNPMAFERTLEQLGAVSVAPARFPDHHAYRADEIRHLLATGAREAELVVTTVKDSVRMPPDCAEAPIWVLEVELAERAGAAPLSEELDWLLAAKGPL